MVAQKSIIWGSNYTTGSGYPLFQKLTTRSSLITRWIDLNLTNKSQYLGYLTVSHLQEVSCFIKCFRLARSSVIHIQSLGKKWHHGWVNCQIFGSLSHEVKLYNKSHITKLLFYNGEQKLHTCAVLKCRPLLHGLLSKDSLIRLSRKLINFYSEVQSLVYWSESLTTYVWNIRAPSIKTSVLKLENHKCICFKYNS